MAIRLPTKSLVTDGLDIVPSFTRVHPSIRIDFIRHPHSAQVESETSRIVRPMSPIHAAPSGTGRRVGLQEVATDPGRGRESPCPQAHDRPTALDRQAHNVEDRQSANLELEVDRPP